MLASALVLLLTPTPAAAQLGGVTLEVPAEHVGLEGHVRPGTWTPMRLTLTHHGVEPRSVEVRWLLHDFDGDRVAARRTGVALNPQAAEHVWLYAPPAANDALEEPWTVQVIDAETGRLLATESVVAEARLESGESAIGLMSAAGLGLQPYTERHTRHEAVRLLRGLRLRDLPDRWYGLAGLEAIIWTREGDGPIDAAVPESSLRALGEWVRRGGHLVLVLPVTGQAWGESPLSDILPVASGRMRRVTGPVPRWLYDVRPTEGAPQIQKTVFDVDGDGGANGADRVLLRDEQDRPVVVAGRHGFGRVTLVGVDLADPRLVGMDLPAGRFRLWNDVFGWQNPVFSEAYIQDEQTARPQRMSRIHQRQPVELGQFVPGLLAMTGTAGPALLAAVLVFGVYWILAGPAAHLLLRRRGLERHAWLVFLGVVLAFSLVSWAGAWAMQGRHAEIAHFSVLDVDAQANEVRSRSWLSLFVPEFGEVALALGDEAPGTLGDGHNVLASPGLPIGLQGAGFLDPRTYELDAAHPRALRVPFRSTAKQLELDYRGPLTPQQPGVTDAWVMPQGRVRMDGAWPVGELSHGLPGTLENVLVVYCPGEGQTPWVWRRERWHPREMLDLEQRDGATWLVRRPREFEPERNWSAEGFLGELIGQKTGRGIRDLDPLRGRIAGNVMVQSAEMLSFYAMLPPPDFRRVDLRSPPAMYERALGRSLDISHLTAERRLIVIGYLDNAPLPAPLTVDGEAADARGWTMVRWVYDL